MGYDLIKTETDINNRIKWDIWGGLYFAGTVYTTIGMHCLVDLSFFLNFFRLW